MDTYAFANQKGGVGKTTVTLTLAAALARRDVSALVVDLDPQASCTKVLGIDVEERTRSLTCCSNRNGARCVTPSSRRSGALTWRHLRRRSRRGSHGARRRTSSFSGVSSTTSTATTSYLWTVRRASAC